MFLQIDDRAPSMAREFVRNSLGTRVIDDSSVAELLVSELVTNAIRHGLPPIVLQVENQSEGIKVRVRDASTDLPNKLNASDDDESGRGVQLVDVLSDDWGVDLDDDGNGKEVWFSLSVM